MCKLPDNLKDWSEVIYNIGLLLSGIVTAFWVYFRYFADKGMLPSIQFDIDLGTLGYQKDRLLVEVLLKVKNVGTSTFVMKNLNLDVLYIEKEERPVLFGAEQYNAGRLVFPHRPFKDYSRLIDEPPKYNAGSSRSAHSDKTRGVPVVRHNTFVQPGVCQAYTFTTAISESATYVLIWSSFKYELRPSWLQKRILLKIGLIDHGLTHVFKEHTCERVFKIDKASLKRENVDKAW